MPHVLLRTGDTARLFATYASGPVDERLYYIDEAISTHFAYAHFADESYGDLWFVPVEGDGPVVACHVTETQSDFSDLDYSVMEVLINPDGYPYSYRIAYRVDGQGPGVDGNR